MVTHDSRRYMRADALIADGNPRPLHNADNAADFISQRTSCSNTQHMRYRCGRSTCVKYGVAVTPYGAEGRTSGPLSTEGCCAATTVTRGAPCQLLSAWQPLPTIG